MGATPLPDLHSSYDSAHSRCQPICAW